MQPQFEAFARPIPPSRQSAWARWSAKGAIKSKRLDWWRATPVHSGMRVQDAAGAMVGRVVAVAMAADGEFEAVEIECGALGLTSARKRLLADQVRVHSGLVVTRLYRAQIAALPDCR